MLECGNWYSMNISELDLCPKILDNGSYFNNLKVPMKKKI